MQTLLRHVWETDRDRVLVPPLSDWLSDYLHDPTPPKRGRGQPKGGKYLLHLAAVSGVYALTDAGLCDTLGTHTGGGHSACDLVAERLQMKPDRVYRLWSDHRKRMAQRVNDLMVASANPESCPDDVRLSAQVTIGLALTSDPELSCPDHVMLSVAVLFPWPADLESFSPLSRESDSPLCRLVAAYALVAWIHDISVESVRKAWEKFGLKLLLK